MLRLSDVSLTEWVKDNEILTSAGKPMYFHGDRKFLFKPFSDFSPQQCWMKGAQVGASESIIVKVLRTIQMFAISSIYTFPTSDLMQKFVQGKVNPIIDVNPALKQMTDKTDNLYMKRIGKSNCIFTGAEKESQAIAFSSDLNIHDEIDSSNLKIIKQFKARQQASLVKWEWLFSHPSLPEVGVHAAWQKSNQQHWFVKCDNGHEEYMNFPESIDEEKKMFICKRCKVEITNKQREQGRWVAKYKISDERPYSGYWIPLFLASWVTAKEILIASKGDQYTFYTRVLGIPYTQGGDKVNIQDVLKNLTPEVNDQEGRVVIGVDTGLPIWYVIGNKQGLFYNGSCKDYEPLKELMRRYPTAIMVIDQGGDLIGSRQMRELFRGRVFLCHYQRDRKTLQLVKWGANDETGNVTVDRNRMIQLVIDEFRDKRIPINGDEDDWYDVALHFTHIYRTTVDNALGVPESKWERFDDDHFVHAITYWRTGMSRFGMQGAKIFMGEQAKPQESPEISPEREMDVPDLKTVFDFEYPSKEDDWRDE